MTDLNLEPTPGDFLRPGDLLYDGPHRGIVVRSYPSEPGWRQGPHYTHYDIVTADGTTYRVALESNQDYQVVRRYADVHGETIPVGRIP